MRHGRAIGLAITALAVVVLLGSLIAGMRRSEGAVARRDQSVERERVRVEVLNAAGVPGLARDATERLRDRGFDVVYYGNARSGRAESSQVVARVPAREAADRVAGVLGISRVLSEPDSTLYLEVTVVLGRDWAEARQAERSGANPTTASTPSAEP